MTSRRSIDDYNVGIICALPRERTAVELMLDGAPHQPIDVPAGDNNVYTFGSVGQHHVVIASLGAGRYGTVSAGSVANDIRRSFPKLRFGLMVGIAGGMPRPDSDDGDVRLGDIVVGCTNGVPSVINYASGKDTADGFEIRSELAEPPEILSRAVAALESQHQRQGPTYLRHLSKMLKDNPRFDQPRLRSDYYNRPSDADRLFMSEFVHFPSETNCDQCSMSGNHQAAREPRWLRNPPEDLGPEEFILRGKDGSVDYPAVFLGTIASADTLMKLASRRDAIYEQVRQQRSARLLCFEMEASGIARDWPCLVIRGICDYSDSHKNDAWQNFAAATAAAYAKDLLLRIQPQAVVAAPPARPTVEQGAIAGPQQTRLAPAYGNSGNWVPPPARDAVPMPRSVGLPRADPNFIDRVELLELVREQASANGAWIALVGLGGIGKTQLAIRYVQSLRERDEQIWVLWIFAAYAARFDESIRDVAEQIGVPKPANPQDDILPAIQTWLADPTRRWVIVLDNADDAEFLRQPSPAADAARAQKPRIEYIPKCDHGTVVITSRSRNEARKFVDDDDIIEINAMDVAHAQTLLRKKLGPLYEPDSAVRLAEALDHMPLALSQAAAFLKQNRRYTIERYLTELEKSQASRTGLLRRHGTVPQRDREASASILLTWQISFESLHLHHRSAADLLALMSFCDRHSIPEILLLDTHHHSSDWEDTSALSSPGSAAAGGTFGDGVEDREGASEDTPEHDDTFERDIQMLEDWSFVSARDESTWDMHRLVQDAMQWWLIDNKHVDDVKSRYMHRLDKAMTLNPEYPANWATFHTLMPHVTSASGITCTGRQMSLSWASAMFRAAWYELRAGYINSAANYAQLSLTMRRELLPDNDSDIANSENILLGAMIDQGRLSKAEDFGLRIMQSRKITFGAEHSHTLYSMVYLALVYGYQGRLEEAENLEVEVLHLRKQVLRPEHPDTLTSMNNLAKIYSDQGRSDEAENLDVEVLQIRKRVLGAEHPETLTSMNNLAATYSNQGRFEEAEELHLELLKLRNRVLGAEHPDTLWSMWNLAATYSNQGRLDEAENHKVEVLKLRKRVLGAEHPDTISSMASLAFTCLRQGRLEEADKLFSEALPLSKKILGAEHPDTLRSMSLLAWTYAEQQRFQEAHDLITVCHEARTRILGNDHPDTQYALSLLNDINEDMQELD